MKELAWGKIGVVVLLLIAVAAVLQLKQQPGAQPSPGSGAPTAQASTVSDKPTGVPRLLDLGSTSCIPCKMMIPVLDELKKTYPGKLQVDFINVNEDRAAAQQYGIDTIPTQIIFDGSGKELYRHIGFYSKDDILAKLKELGVKL